MSKLFSRQFLLGATALLLYLALAKLLLHLWFSSGYGYFRDEFYYLACGEHLDWGYVDQPPLTPLLAFLTRQFLGESLVALRFLPAVAGALLVLVTGLMARELGGGRFAQGLAAVAVIAGPIYLSIDHIFTVNAFDHLFWALGACVLIRIVKTDDPRLWLVFGLVAGVGLQNKISVLFFGFGVAIALLLTPYRKYLLSKWLWLGGLIAFAIFLPYVIWQSHYDWPMLELLRRGQLYKNFPISPLQFLWGQVLEVHPFNLPIWLAGLYFYLVSKPGKTYRVLGWTYVVIFVLFLVLKAKTYYLAPAYPMLLAAGAFAIETFICERQWNWLKPATVGLLVAGGTITAPLAMPMLPVETYIKYQSFLGVEPPPTERHRFGKLPQLYADMFGWENMVATVAKVYNSLPPEERAKCAIFTSNYGEAGAIDFFGKKYGLPKAISGHNNYWLWGPGNHTGEIVITVGPRLEDVKKTFDQVELGATVVSEYAMPYESDLPVYICRKPKVSLQEVWPRVKGYM
ncbi:MAG: glycosyltransferase family 39 protein [Terriglobia bacterium]